jgi:hypothetical protein
MNNLRNKILLYGSIDHEHLNKDRSYYVGFFNRNKGYGTMDTQKSQRKCYKSVLRTIRMYEEQLKKKKIASFCDEPMEGVKA